MWTYKLRDIVPFGYRNRYGNAAISQRFHQVSTNSGTAHACDKYIPYVAAGPYQIYRLANSQSICKLTRKALNQFLHFLP